MRLKNKVVGICGGSGSGKTYLLNLLTARLGDRVCVLSQDHYYKALELQEKDSQGQVNFDLPSAIDEKRFVHDLDCLINGHQIQVKEYTFNNPAVRPRSLLLKPAPIIIVEGLFIFHCQAIRERLSLKVFIEADETLALERRLERDIDERAYTREMILYQWKNHVMPAYERFLLPYRDNADLFVHNEGGNNPAIETLPDIEALLNNLDSI